MPVKPVQKITAWSFSRWKDYEQCPLKAKFKHVDKIKEPGSAAMDRGSEIHKLAEDYAMGKLAELPQELACFGEEFEILRDRKPSCELEWAFDNEWHPTTWFAPKAWCRIKVDACLSAVGEPTKLIVIDHKTGKVNPDHKDQLGLYALGAFNMLDYLQTVDARLWYLDQGEEGGEVFERGDVPELTRTWARRTKAMLSDTKFLPTPSNKCRWCFFSKEKGGACQY